MNDHQDLERLRSLLLGSDKETLNQVHKLLGDKSTRAETFAEVLPAASLKASEKDPDAFATALEEPVSAAMHASIERDPNRLASVLFPVMMPAIRRAIADTMRQFMERIDNVVNQSFSVESFKWRVESLRTGIPFQEIVLRETLLFNVEQVLLIENGSGLLMQHLHSSKAKTADSDAVSGMLWAIESFVRDSFTQDPEEGLNRVTMGDHIVYLDHGPHATLACVVQGVATPEFLDRMGSVLNRLHLQHAQLINPFSGDKQQLTPTLPLLEECVQTEYKKDKETKRDTLAAAVKLAIFSAIVIAGSLALYNWLVHKTEEKHVADLVNRLNAEPGIMVVNHQANEDRWNIRGLRDPLSTAPEQLINPKKIGTEKLDFDLRPYVSLEPPIRLKRIRKALQLPYSVHLDLSGETLTLTGAASIEKLRELEASNHTPTGLSKVNYTDLNLLEDDVKNYLLTHHNLPADTDISVQQREIQILSTLPSHFSTTISDIQADLKPIATLAPATFAPDPELLLQKLLNKLNQQHLLFSEYASLAPESIAKISEIASLTIEAAKLAQGLNQSLRLFVIGHSTAEGNNEVNSELRLRRANTVRRALIDEGVTDDMIVPSEGFLTASELRSLGGLAKRAELQVSIIEHRD